MTFRILVGMLYHCATGESWELSFIHDITSHFFLILFVFISVWKRRLVLRHKLTMHTAFAREDNSAPAAITALLVSK